MRGLPTDQATVELHTTESEVITDKIDPSIFQEGEVTAKVTAANVDSATESCKEVAIDVAAADVDIVPALSPRPPRILGGSTCSPPHGIFLT